MNPDLSNLLVRIERAKNPGDRRVAVAAAVDMIESDARELLRVIAMHQDLDISQLEHIATAVGHLTRARTIVYA
jgi:hypothetical protein